MKKLIIGINVGHLQFEDGSLDTVLEKFQYFKDTYGDNLRLELDGGYDGYYGYLVYQDREETDEEYNLRFQEEEKKRKKDEMKEMSRLLKCQTLNADEKAKLIKYIQEYK